MATGPRVKFNIQLGVKIGMDRAKLGVAAATLEAVGIVHRDILGSNPKRTGRAYKRGKSKTHIASAPGESPAPDTAQLRNSTSAEFLEDLNTLVAVGKVVNNLEKAQQLELGTVKDGGRIMPRPWISRLLGAEFRGRIFAAFVKGAGRF